MKTNPKTLTKAEEEIMQALWQLDKAFVKDIVDLLPAPKPHYNTVSTIIKILCDKGFVGYESFGKSNRYYPLVQKDEYSMLSFFAQEKDITVQDLEAILKELKQSPDKK
jgi:predicted transcriptional regulator